jgi:hypothetical protein
MATEFFRLYRELGRVDINGKPDDIKYNKDRKYVLGALGHDVGFIPEPTKASKHHGRVARRRLKEKLEDAVKVDKRLEQSRARLLLDVTNQNNELRDMLKGIEQVNPTRRMPDSFWTQYGTLFPNKDALTVTTNAEISVSPPVKDTSPGRTRVEPTVPRTETIIRKSFTTNRWSTAERDRMNKLYWEINRPIVSDSTAWKEYYQEFAARFRSYYPNRTPKEIVVKAKELVSRRALKEPGEKEFWSTVGSSGSPL